MGLRKYLRGGGFHGKVGIYYEFNPSYLQPELFQNAPFSILKSTNHKEEDEEGGGKKKWIGGER